MIKKTLLAVSIAFFFTCALKAQIHKNDWLLGGNLGYNTNNSTGNFASSNINFNPHIGLAIADNSVIGLSFQFGYNTQKYNASNFASKIHNLNFFSAAFFKKYYAIKNKIGWYGQLNAGAGIQKSIDYDSSGVKTSTSTTQNYTVGFTPGIYYQATPFILLTADFGGINYQYATSTSYAHSSSFGVSFLSSFSFGVDFILSKHSKM